MASTEVEEPSQPLESKKRWVLRVSIHCEGCKRKVKKLLQSLPGVHEIDIETKLQRVVVTGDVSPESLIRKLVKAGKHAELWPENPPEIPNQKTQKPPTSSHGEESVVSRKDIKSPAIRTEIPVADPSKASSTTVSGGCVTAGDGGKGGGKVDEGVGKSEVTGGDGKVAIEVTVEEKKPETGSAGNQASQPVVEKKEEQTDQTDGGGAGGGEGRKKKKKKKKAENSYENGIGETSSPPVFGGSGNDGGRPPVTASNQSPPRHQYPPPYYYTPPPPPPPVYTVSYNAAHPPINSYTASYYATPPPQSYAYSHYRSEMEPQAHHQPSDFDSYSDQPPLDSFEMFSDENPNGCLVM
ncbi:heavy metal-associated isoprenylated plant protein 35-like [Cynara cardunculus var. scolymus]|uniref:HMA domain-containing protein n=1 Tax=Cynara cardunculus var. scolymus TaxID=59895 RepID=A0A103YL71_CYNCS|nr:heavy metal-associated isoprenylated plant protein 35-like [Cynara cardunculus var. scolymus]KVI11114.1 hypothetical protein Ccrd_010478 [Cynara cardunculus var. scolymus]